MYKHPQHARTQADEAFDRQPYIQIDTNLWAVMRESRSQPVAMILGLANRDSVPLFFVTTWHPVPDRRRVISQHDTLEAANASVLWDVSLHTTGREHAVDGSGPRPASGR